MARWAFVMGSNGPQGLGSLKYASKDASRIAKYLEGPRCGFKVVRARKNEDKHKVLARLEKLAHDCKAEDTLVCYFSGHGEIEKGELFLVWDQKQTDLLKAGIPVNTVLFTMRFSKAQNKLLILDCCRAGAAIGKAGAGVPVKEVIKSSNQMILMASDRLETAREFDELKGGFLTIKICEALDKKFNEADKDRDHRLSIKDLLKWLEESALEHNSSSAEKVPQPHLHGDMKGDFFLTQETWSPYEIAWPDGSTLVLLPVYPDAGRAVCIGKHPVTNSQYQRFTQACAKDEPVGNYLPPHSRAWKSAGSTKPIELEWRGQFYPWREDEFRHPDKPVVCVSHEDAISYCKWVDQNLRDQHPISVGVFLPPYRLWNYAAFGSEFSPMDSKSWLSTSQQQHHKADSPAMIDNTGARSNGWGVTDLLGNVWEWCSGDVRVNPSVGAAFRNPPKILGGGFADDLSLLMAPSLDSYEIAGAKAEQTRNFDLGFRISAMVFVNKLPEDVQTRLSLCEKRSSDFWAAIRGA